MAWNEKIFSYCERGLNPAFWAEPANAVTNFAFIFGAFIALMMLIRRPRSHWDADHYLLIFMVFVIGIGSFLFHTYATRWAVMADVIPITLFMFIYMAFALNRFVDIPAGWTAVCVMIFAGVSTAAGELRCGAGQIGYGDGSVPYGVTCLNGSVGYVPALISLWLVGLVLNRKRHPAALTILSAGAVFLVSLSLRTVDRTMCELTIVNGYRLGTHFAWHLLNALTLFLLLKAAIDHVRRAPETEIIPPERLTKTASASG